MDVFDAILDRRSIRKFADKEVPEEMVQEIIRAGMYAPSANNKQPWQFVVIRDRATHERIRKVHPFAGMMRTATLAILICGDKSIEENEGYLNTNCSAATQNMLLAVHGIGLGGVWLGIFPRANRIKPVCELFSLPGHILPISLLAIGWPDEFPERPERYQPEKIHYETW